MKHINHKRIVAFLLLLIFYCQCFGNLLFVADYYTDTQVYAANCINKDKPQLHCNGKCQLQKKLDENNNKDKQNAEKKNEASSNIFSSKSFFAFVETLLNIQDKQKFFTYNFRIPINDSFQFFHPPQHFHVI